MHQDKSQPATTTVRPPVRLHGVLVRVFGTGVLLIGDSGVGKSECALDLITRGHRLVADDAVDITLKEGRLRGSAPLPTTGLLEIRGLGVFNVKSAFGVEAICESSTVNICVEFRTGGEGERVGNFVHEHEIAGQTVPKFIVPVSPGRNLAILVETAARLFLNRENGATAGDALLANTGNLPAHLHTI
jgi:HPr kinase/phosphorylase